jgi:hypothetical protein
MCAIASHWTTTTKMNEITGDLWEHYGKPNTIVCITTNGVVKTNGEVVMGRGCAAEAARRFPGIRRVIGDHIRESGNTLFEPTPGVYTFPVKHKWWEVADPLLIATSTRVLREIAEIRSDVTFILPRPGCGNGRLKWEMVKPLLEGLPDNVLVISHAA